MSTRTIDQELASMQSALEQERHAVACLRGELKKLRGIRQLSAIHAVVDTLNESLHYSPQDDPPSDAYRVAVVALVALLEGK